VCTGGQSHTLKKSSLNLGFITVTLQPAELERVAPDQAVQKTVYQKNSLFCLITEGKPNISRSFFYKSMKLLPLISMNTGLTLKSQQQPLNLV